MEVGATPGPNGDNPEMMNCKFCQMPMTIIDQVMQSKTETETLEKYTCSNCGATFEFKTTVIAPPKTKTYHMNIPEDGGKRVVQQQTGSMVAGQRDLSKV